MRILVAEDDEALEKFVRQGLEGEHYSVDVLPDGEQARAAAIQFDYDVVILDLNLPKLDGVSVLRYLPSKEPSLPVLVLTQRTRVEDRVQCLDTGADDYIPKHLSPGSLDIEHIRQDLLVKIRAAAESRKSHLVDVLCRKPPRFSLLKTSDTVSANAPAIVVVGTSTGGPKALQEMLPLFPRDLSVPILIVQHLPPGFTGAFAQRMNSLCSLTVREATQGERIQAGVVYIAPAGVHMTVLRPSDSQAMIWLDTHPEDCSYIPSVDVLMKAVAETFGNGALGVIMTEWAPMALKELRLSTGRLELRSVRMSRVAQSSACRGLAPIWACSLAWCRSLRYRPKSCMLRIIARALQNLFRLFDLKPACPVTDARSGAASQ